MEMIKEVSERKFGTGMPKTPPKVSSRGAQKTAASSANNLEIAKLKNELVKTNGRMDTVAKELSILKDMFVSAMNAISSKDKPESQVIVDVDVDELDELDETDSESSAEKLKKMAKKKK